jgi:hypothetical protein
MTTKEVVEHLASTAVDEAHDSDQLDDLLDQRLAQLADRVRARASELWSELAYAGACCRECGEPCFRTDVGVSHHGTPDEIDHDADGRHVAIPEEE